jgi:tetratricopeptide (TPR) repeat protein
VADADFDRNLLFGVLALQDELIDADQFADVCAGWALRMEKPLPDLLQERGWLSADERREIEQRLERKIKKHGGNVHATLNAVAGGDVAVRGAIQSVAHPAVQKSLEGLPLLQPPPAAGYVLAETVLRPTESRSRYTLTRLHAEGGLGKVWVAHDTALNRDVALKEIKGERAANPASWSRFLKEAQITGQLEHPNIIPVYELGRRPEDEQPFYTMRLVRGLTLRDAIAAHHERRGEGRADTLELQKLLTTFVAVCQAIGYAHSRGVIHRDLKPENIILGSFGEVIVLDWGLAKVVDQPAAPEPDDAARVTLSAEASAQATAGLIGTPAYMAPEQAEARHDLVDERTDVYGLGAILFEILTGHAPHEGPSPSELLRTLSTAETPHARALVPTVPPALDAICARATARSRSDRYSRATDLAEDIQRWIADEPVTAFPDPWTTRVGRWGRRHKTGVTSAAALLVLGVIGLSVHDVRIGRERAIALANAREAVKQAGIADEHRRRAEENFGLARGAVDAMLTEVGEVELADVPQVQPVRERLLAKAQRFYLAFLNERKDDSTVRGDVGRGYCRLGEIEELLGNFPRAEHHYQQAIAQLGRGDDLALRADCARALHDLGILLKKANRFQEAETTLRAALRLRAELATDAPTEAKAEAEQALAQTRYHLGALVAKLPRRRGEEEEAYRAALQMQQRLVADARDRPEHQRALARSLNNLGILLRDTGRLGEAEAAYNEALATARALADVPHATAGDRWQWAQVENNLGVLLKETDRASEAASAYHKARDLQEELAADFPQVPIYRKGLAATENNLGLLGMGAAAAEGPRAGAESAFLHALKLLEALVAEFPGVPEYRSRLSQTQLNLGTMLETIDAPRAEAMLRAAHKEMAALAATYPGVPEYTFALGNTLFCLGDLLAHRNDLPEARDLLNQALKQHRAALESNPQSPAYRRALCVTYRDYAEVLRRLGAHAELAGAITELPTLAPDDPDAYRYAAYYLAQCAALAASNSQTPAAQRDPLQRHYGQLAVATLRHAFEKHLIADPRELANPNLDPIRNRADFQALLHEMKRHLPAATEALSAGIGRRGPHGRIKGVVE